MKWYYVANARMPNEKAHGIQIAKMCEAFIEAGIELELVVPARQTAPGSVQNFYGLAVPVPMTKLAILDGYRWGRVGYAISSLTFMLSYLLFFVGKRMRGERFILYTIDIDTFASAALALIGQPIYTEMHVARAWNPALALLFRKAKGVITINSIIIRELRDRFPRVAYVAAPNGVDLTRFGGKSRDKARRTLSLPSDERIVLYAGRFLEWKGLEILPLAAADFPRDTLLYMVGGTKEEFESLTRRSAPAMMRFVGEQPHQLMPLWLAAADVLLVIGTKRDAQSYFYTSPMKLFEYLAAGRSIVASGTPAIREIVSEAEVSFYAPDEPSALAEAVRAALADPQTAADRSTCAARKALEYSWERRAQKIIGFVRTTAEMS